MQPQSIELIQKSACIFPDMISSVLHVHCTRIPHGLGLESVFSRKSEHCSGFVRHVSTS